MGAERARKCKRSAEEVPSPRDPDRKRVLNVLAQRRYRERKRQRLADLEAKLRSVQSQSSKEASTTQTTAGAESCPSTTQIVQGTGPEWTNVLFPELQSDAQLFAGEECSPPPPDLQPTDWSAIPAALVTQPASDCDHSEFIALPTPSTSDDSAALFDNLPPSNDNGQLQFFTGQCRFPSNVVDGQALSLQNPMVLSDQNAFLDAAEVSHDTSASDSDNSMSQFSHISFPPIEVIARQTPDLNFPSSSTLIHPNQLGRCLSPGVQNDVSSLDMPMLKIMKAGFFITDMLNCTSQIWDPFFRHVVQNQPPNLPPHFKATAAQQNIPHHPVFDVIPWASARTKLIHIFSQPPELRPPSARDPLAVVNMIMDIDDDAEGMRICGEDGWDCRNWEVGEIFFRNWWWALDREIVENSNRLRARRGARKLRLRGA
ncbi:hypothetical protein BGW36DRAFT_370600 [Talaromyces proteolyticus]|uniref:BZIP domain-containing protein n=1 Tax=Talaromyces proteolyticus TaxID=1131652 RepID=A0AAD4Q5L3_9EURO|nr:uncharacterized protein BGW36DRAFT_370600 [Talaromyces proteolyticus]KAH8704105.1 hypothetical protein BGW36DRAFT_370600 [Talaromyces proteolyticus]